MSRLRVHSVGLRRVVLVPQHRLLQNIPERRAEALVSQIAGQTPTGLSDEERRSLRERLTNGQLALVILEEPIQVMCAPWKLEDREPAEEGTGTGWIEILVSSPDEEGYHDAILEVSLPNRGSTRAAVGSDGVWRARGLERGGGCALQSISEFGALGEAHAQAPSADFEHVLSPKLGEDATIRDLQRDAVHHVIVDRPSIWRPETCVFPTSPDSALAVPAPWSDGEHPWQPLLAVLHHVNANDGMRLVIVGHHGSDEGDSRELASTRADAYACMLQGNRDRWVELATASGNLRDVKAYLDYLARVVGWPCPIEPGHSEDDEEAREAISRFQETYNEMFEGELVVDGICGEQTLGAVFDVLLDELDHWLEKHGLQRAVLDDLAIDCVDAEETDLARCALPSPVRVGPGVDLLVVPSSRLASTPPTAQALYDSRVALLSLLPVPGESGAWKTGPVTIIVDEAPGRVRVLESFRLYASDGSYDKTQTIPDDATDDGLSRLDYEDVPIGPTYTIEVKHGDEDWEVVIENVSYADLHKATQSTEEDSGGAGR